jgi:hypothetical protein
MKRVLFFVIAPVGAAFGVLACETATNLDVSYAAPDAADAANAATDPDAGAGADANADAGVDADAGTGERVVLEGCPCDPAAGLGCCVTSTGAFCTDDLTTCSDARGAWLRCAKRDPVFESECCWMGSGAGSMTRFAAACDGGPTACLTDADCIGTGQKCQTNTCAGFEIGQCAATQPPCPNP